MLRENTYYQFQLDDFSMEMIPPLKIKSIYGFPIKGLSIGMEEYQRWGVKKVNVLWVTCFNSRQIMLLRQLFD